MSNEELIKDLYHVRDALELPSKVGVPKAQAIVGNLIIQVLTLAHSETAQPMNDNTLTPLEPLGSNRFRCGRCSAEFAAPPDTRAYSPTREQATDISRLAREAAQRLEDRYCLNQAYILRKIQRSGDPCGPMKTDIIGYTASIIESVLAGSDLWRAGVEAAAKAAHAVADHFGAANAAQRVGASDSEKAIRALLQTGGDSEA